MILLLGLATSAGCGTGHAETDAATHERAERGPLRVRRGDLADTVLLTGELQAIEADRIVVPRTPTWQMPIRWMEADGAEVAAGQKVLELDNTQFSGDLEEKRLAESAALNQLMQKQADIAVELADKRFAVEQTRILLEKAVLEADVPEQLRSRREHQEKQLELAKAEVANDKALEELGAAERAADSEREELEIALQKAKDDVQTAEQAIAALTLHAPRDGILVVAENRREGRKFQVGDQAWVGLPLMQIPELSRMKVEAHLSDVDDGRVTVGMAAVAVLDTYPEREYRGRIVDVTPIAQEQGNQSLRRAFRVVVQLDEADPERMRPGMSAKVAVYLPQRTAVLIVPRRAIDFSSEVPRARIANGEWAELDLGPCNAFECVVDEGLLEGSRLTLARGAP